MDRHKTFKLAIPNKSINLGKQPIMMGILNITPDSFSDGGLHRGNYSALEHAQNMLNQGANIIDIGGESTKPTAKPISVQTELDRVIPLIKLLSEHEPNCVISIDSYKAVVADKAIKSGAKIINDVKGLQGGAELADMAALHNVPIIIMHWDKARNSKKDIIAEMKRFFKKSLSIARNAGIKDNKIVLDPGFGFAKTLKENYEILRRLDELHSLGFPLLIGTSNKSMIGKLLDLEINERLAGTIATNVLAYNNGAHIFRVHDVKQNLNALKVAKATLYGS
ncbi:MAG: dihydropteroate synthase [Devosiaceae bacterium]|nr:dihydropteroate synthase [Devosiaceae bacterium]